MKKLVILFAVMCVFLMQFPCLAAAKTTGNIYQEMSADTQQEASDGMQQETSNSSTQQEISDSIQGETESILDDLGLSAVDSYLQQEEAGQLTFSGLVRDLMKNGLAFEFSSVGKAVRAVILQDFHENRKVLLQILTLAVAFSILLQMTPNAQKTYLADTGFLGIYLILMLLLLKLFLVMTGTVEGYLAKLTDFMQVLQPVFCLSMVFSTGSMSAGVYYELLLLLIFLIETVFVKILLPIVQIYMVLQLVNYMMEDERFTRIAGFLSNSVKWCTKAFLTVVIGFNFVQGLLAPGIDGMKRSVAAGAVRVVPGIGQIMNSTTEILAGSAMLIKNSVGAAALVILAVISFLPLLKIAVFMLLYQGCAALLEPVADKRICAATAALGQSAALYLRLMFYAVMLFFLSIAVICTVTTLSAR